MKGPSEPMTTCSVCSGAIPEGVTVDGHTALCAAVVAKEKAEAIELAWGVIANAYGGAWDDAPPEWREAAEAWRERFYAPAMRERARRKHGE